MTSNAPANRIARSIMPTPPQSPRVLSLGLFHRDGRILVARGIDTVKGEVFYRPFGGGVEFGESSQNALHREIREELDQSIQHVRLIGVVENIFTFEGRSGHEVIFLHEAVFLNDSLYGQEEIEGIEEHLGARLRGVWIKLDDVRCGNVTLYPEKIRPLLETVC